MSTFAGTRSSTDCVAMLPSVGTRTTYFSYAPVVDSRGHTVTCAAAIAEHTQNSSANTPLFIVRSSTCYLPGGDLHTHLLGRHTFRYTGAMEAFTPLGFLLRLLAAIALVLCTF